MPQAPQFDRSRIEQLLGEGLLYREVAAEVGCSVALVGHVARASGRKRGKRGRASLQPREHDRDEIMRLVTTEPQLTYRQIADRVGCSDSLVGITARAAGVRRHNRPKTRGPAPVAGDEVLALLRRLGPSTERQIAEEHGHHAWRILDALRRRGLVTCDRTKRPHQWRVVERTARPGVVEVVSEMTVQLVRAADGRRYLMIPWESDLRDS